MIYCSLRYRCFIVRPLGHLQYIRIWHNNMAYDDFASWFLSKIIIKDVQTGEKYEFICNQWLAVEHGDGEVSKIFFENAYCKGK